MEGGFFPAAEIFAENFRQEKTQLAWCWLSSDLETPLSAYLKLGGSEPHTFVLESVEGGATLGRYSIIGLKPDSIWRCRGETAEIRREQDAWSADSRKPVESLRTLLAESRIDIADPSLPPMAVSGLFGFLGYDMVRLNEKIPDKNTNDLGLPDSILMRPTVLAVFDNVKSMICLVTPVYHHAGNSEQNAETVYNNAASRLARALEDLKKPLAEMPVKTALQTPLKPKANMTEADFKSIVAKTIEYIRAGEIFQGVLSQRFSVPFDLPPIALYRALRRLNPSPFMFHLAFEDFSIVGSSPEILVRVRNGTVTIRPIAGTRPRGKDAAEDKALAADLLADPKERAEHLMLLDLGRNDIGRVAETGTVKVTEQFVVENYSHVMHIVSNVQGALKKGLDIIDALFAGFPAGTVSGAPKVRAMEIIDELEPVRRGIYGGGIGYFSGNKEMDSCIALRTAVIKDNTLYVQAGAGIVADSNADSEYQETCNKAQAIIRSAELAVEQAQPSQKRA